MICAATHVSQLPLWMIWTTTHIGQLPLWMICTTSHAHWPASSLDDLCNYSHWPASSLDDFCSIANVINESSLVRKKLLCSQSYKSQHKLPIHCKHWTYLREFKVQWFMLTVIHSHCPCNWGNHWKVETTNLLLQWISPGTVLAALLQCIKSTISYNAHAVLWFMVASATWNWLRLRSSLSGNFNCEKPPEVSEIAFLLLTILAPIGLPSRNLLNKLTGTKNSITMQVGWPLKQIPYQLPCRNSVTTHGWSQRRSLTSGMQEN